MGRVTSFLLFPFREQELGDFTKVNFPLLVPIGVLHWELDFLFTLRSSLVPECSILSGVLKKGDFFVVGVYMLIPGP
jgi:hypothetical protein